MPSSVIPDFLTVKETAAKKPYQFPVTNTRVFTNALVENGKTNLVAFESNVVYNFIDPFLPLRDFDTPEDLRWSIAGMFIPQNDLIFTNDESRLMKKYRLSKIPGLLTDEELYRYSEEAFYRQYRVLQRSAMQFTDDEKQHLNIGFEQWETKVVVSGWVNLQGGYGWLFRSEDNVNPVPGVLQGLSLNQNMNVNIVGKIGDRVSVNINHSSDNPDNQYEVAFKALDSDKGFLKELRAGNISLNIPQSSYFVKYAGTSKDSYGVKSVFQFGDLNIQSVLELTTSKKGYKKFVGLRQQQTLTVAEVNYSKRKYFLLPDLSIDNGTVELLASTTVTNVADRRIDSLYFKRMVAGVDYFINLATGELTLTNNLDRGMSLVIHYTKAGALFTTNALSMVGMDNDKGDKFLYLWNATSNFSQYIHYGYYQLGYSGFDATRGFSLSVVYTADKTKIAPFQFTSADYFLSPVNGTIKFNSVIPFPDVSGNVYTNATDPSIADSTYSMIINLYNQVNSYQLDYGIIPGTERVYLNGRLLATTEYTILNATGELSFNNQSLINDNDTVEIYYEYKPFWSGSQKIGIAARADWKPSNLFNIGSTVVYNIAQRDAGAPNITATPDGVFMADLDTSLNVARMFSLPEAFEANVKGEYAVSIRDPNTVGYAIVDDFENTGETFSFSKGEFRWILSAPDTNIAGINYTNRGQLLYKDYRDYQLDGSFNLLNYSSVLTADKIKDYSSKPGPYASLGGHLNPALYPSVSQSSLIFDYDFSQGGSWVGAAYSIAGPSGIDLSTFNQIKIWVKLQSDENGDNVFSDTGSGSVDFFIAVGGMNEDSDGSGFLEGEVDRAQAGYPFSNYTNKSIVDTYVGRGRQGGGDGYIQTEDLNGNGILDTNNNTVVFPGNGYTDISNATITQNDWTQITINIRALSPAQISALQHATSLGFYIRNKSGTRGRLIVDVVDFKKISWKEKLIDGIQSDDSTALSGDSISVFNDPLYSRNRFYDVQSTDTNVQERVRVFEKLHGPRSVSEALQYNERSLGLDYHLSNIIINTNLTPEAGGLGGVLVKRNTAAYDISKYNYLDFYVYVPDVDENGNPLKAAGDTFTNENFVLVVGTTEKSFYKWSIPLASVAKNQWHLVTINIFQGLAMQVDNIPISGYDKPAVTGYPNLVDVNYLEMGVETTSTNEPVNSGTVWVDEMYVNSDTSQFGMAYYVNPTLEYKKPVLSFGDLEVLGPVSLKGYYESKDVNFIPSEGIPNGSFNNNLNVSWTSSVLRDIQYAISYNDNNQGTTTNQIDLPQYLQWNSRQNIFSYSLTYAAKDYIPSVTHSFTETFDHRLSRSLVNGDSNDYVMGFLDDQYSGAAKIALSEVIPVFQQLSIQPRASVQDSYFIYDHSNYTNEDSQTYISNGSAYGMKDLLKTITAGTGVNFWMFTLSGDYSQSVERYTRIMTASGYRQEITALGDSTLAERYGDRLLSLVQGFTFPDEQLDKQNSENYIVSLGGDHPLPFFSFWVGEKLGRNAGSFTYDNSGVLLGKAENYLIGSDNKLNLYPKWVFLDTVNIRLARDFQIGYSSIQNGIFYSNVFTDFGNLYYNLPNVYSAILGGSSGRSNSLELVGKYSDGMYASSAQLSDGLTVEVLLPGMGKILDSILPKRYLLSTILLTGRSLSSFYQTLNNQVDTSLPLKITEWGLPFLRSSGEFRVGDILLTFSYRDTAAYNERRISDTVSFGGNDTLWLNRTLSLFFSYNVAYSSDTFITNAEPFETNFGFQTTPPNNSPVKRYSHSGNVVLNWVIEDVQEINLLLFKIDLHGSSINSRESILVTGDTVDYDGLNFASYMRKIYEITFDHSTEFHFSDYLSGTFLLKAVLNQYAQVTALLNSPQISYFPPGLGLQLSVDLKIRF